MLDLPLTQGQAEIQGPSIKIDVRGAREPSKLIPNWYWWIVSIETKITKSFNPHLSSNQAIFVTRLSKRGEGVVAIPP